MVAVRVCGCVGREQELGPPPPLPPPPPPGPHCSGERRGEAGLCPVAQLAPQLFGRVKKSPLRVSRILGAKQGLAGLWRGGGGGGCA